MMTSLPSRSESRSLSFATAVSILLCLRADAETNGCNLLPDDREPSVMILRCGDDLTLRIAANTDFRLAAQKGHTLRKGCSSNPAR